MDREEIILWLVLVAMVLSALSTFIRGIISWYQGARRPGSSGGEKITLDEICDLLRVIGNNSDALLNHPIIKQFCIENGIPPEQISGFIEALCQALNWPTPEMRSGVGMTQYMDKL